MSDTDDSDQMDTVFGNTETTFVEDDDVDLSGDEDESSADEVTDTDDDSDAEMEVIEEAAGQIDSSPAASVGSTLTDDEDDLFTGITVISESSGSGKAKAASSEMAQSFSGAAKAAVREVNKVQPKMSPFLGQITKSASSGAKKNRPPASSGAGSKAKDAPASKTTAASKSKKRKAEGPIPAAKKAKHESSKPKKTMLLETSSMSGSNSASALPDFPASIPKSQTKPKSKPRPKTVPVPPPAAKKTVEAGDLVQCMTSGSLAQGSGRNQKMVVTGGNTVNSILDPQEFMEKGGGKIERPNDGDVRNMYQKLGKTFSDTVQVSHILPELDAHTPENSHNRGAVLNGFLVPRRVKSKSDNMKNVDWHFFPLNPTNELNLYRMEYVDKTNQNEQGQIQAKYKEIYNCGNIRQSDGPLTVEFPKNTGKQWSFDHRWFSTAGFETIKVQSQRPASKKKAAPEPQPESSQPATDPRAKDKKAAKTQGKNKAPPVPSPASVDMELLLANQKRILANQERIMNMKFLSQITVEMPSGTDL